MRNLAIAIAAVLVMAVGGFMTWTAQATPLGVLSLPNYSPIEKVGCRGWGRCPYGRYWACGPYRCWCAPCGPYGYRYRY
jgi:hypothetical protein